MNEQVKSVALALPEPTTLATILKNEGRLGSMISELEASARGEAKAHDAGTRKGRDALKSIAHKVSQSKVELDKKGLALTERARKEIDAVNAGRKLAKKRLDSLRDEIKKPALDWEAAEEVRVQSLKDRLTYLDADRADAHGPSEQIAAVLAEIEAIEVGEDWQEYQAEAALAKETALTALRNSLEKAKKREAEARELAELRELKAKQEEEDRARREAESAAEELRNRADKARAYIKEAGEGRIGGNPQSFGILIYELDTKIVDNVDQLGEHAEAIHDLRKSTLSALKSRMEKQQLEDEAKAEQERKEAAEKAARNAKEEAEQKAAEKAATEQRRLEDEARKEADAKAAREADQQHRNCIRSDIIEALSQMQGNATPEGIADALMGGEIPHTEVTI